MQITKLSLIQKIIVFQVVCVVIAMTTVGALSVEVGMYHVQEKAEQQLAGVRDIRKAAVETYLESVRQRGVAVAKEPDVISALAAAQQSSNSIAAMPVMSGFMAGSDMTDIYLMDSAGKTLLYVYSSVAANQPSAVTVPEVLHLAATNAIKKIKKIKK